MQITKQNETFSFKEVTEFYEITGNVAKDINSSLNIHFTINKISGEYLGDVHYNRYNESDNINFGINCLEENRDEIIASADSIIDYLLNHFSTLD